jgi:hypothetical protein
MLNVEDVLKRKTLADEDLFGEDEGIIRTYIPAEKNNLVHRFAFSPLICRAHDTLLK